MSSIFYCQEMKTILIFILLITINTGVFAQSTSPVLSDDDITKMLPSIEEVIDSTLANDPWIKFRDLQTLVNKNKLKAEQSYWLKNIGVQGDLRYGTFNTFSTNATEGQTPDNFASQESEFNYGVGAYIKFPLYDILNRKNQISFATNELEQARTMLEVQKKEIRQLVINQYNDLILKFNILKIKANYLTLINSNTLMAEKEFRNGVINITEITRISGIQSVAESDYEKARVDFITAYMLLEDIAGMKFNLGAIPNK